MLKDCTSEAGAVAVLVAVLILPLTLLLAFAVDTGNWWVHKRHLQTQADAGVLAGALGPWFPACDETSIESHARQYANAPFNPQYTNSSNVHVLLNSANYFENGGSDFSGGGRPCDLLAASDAAHPAYLDLKVTETNLTKFFASIAGVGSVTAHAHARVEIQGVQQENDLRPIAVRDDADYQCAHVQLWTADSSGNPSALLTTINLPSRTVLADGSTQFQDPAGSGNITLPNPAQNIAVRILLGNTGCATTDGYADPSGGVNFINVYKANGVPPSGSPPNLHSVSIPPALSTCTSGSPATPDPYFSTNSGTCDAVVKAYVDFAPGAVTSGVGKNAFVTVNGIDATAGSDAGGVYWTADVPIAAQSGPNMITIAWEQQYGTISGKTCKKNGNPTQCKGSFNVQQQAFSATSDPDVTNSGSLSLVRIGELGGSLTGANSFAQGSTHNFVITVQIQGLANSKPGDPPIVFKYPVQGSKRTGLIDCGQGNGAQADENAIINGCPLGVYIWPDGSPCVVPPSNPIDCVNPIPGNRRQKIAGAIATRVGNSCNNWNAYRDSGGTTPIPVGDPREIAMIITAPGDLSGNTNGPPIPVRALATFYITGWDGGAGNGKGCANEPYPGSGSSTFAIWGHWIKFVPPGGIGNGKGCIPNQFGDCVAVLTQ
jgi:hypothetical protein